MSEMKKWLVNIETTVAYTKEVEVEAEDRKDAVAEGYDIAAELGVAIADDGYDDCEVDSTHCSARPVVKEATSDE